MTRLPRLVLGAALAVALAATARAAEPDKLIPADADSVTVINVKQLVASEFVKKYALEQLKKGLEKQDDTKRLLSDVGIDPTKDVEKLVVATIDTKYSFGPMQQQQDKSVTIIRGTFDADKLFRRAEEETRTNPGKFSKLKEDGVVIFKFHDKADEKAVPVFLTMIDEKTIVTATDTKYIAAAVKASDAGKAAPINKELAALIRKVDDKVSVYIASVTTGKFDAADLPKAAGPFKLEDFGKALAKAETSLITIRVGADVNLDVIMGMKDEESANDMRNAMTDMLDQLKPIAKSASGFLPELKPLPDMLDAIKVTSKNKDMILTVKLAGSDVGPLLGLQEKFGKKKEVKKN